MVAFRDSRSLGTPNGKYGKANCEGKYEDYMRGGPM